MDSLYCKVLKLNTRLDRSTCWVCIWLLTCLPPWFCNLPGQFYFLELEAVVRCLISFKTLAFQLWILNGSLGARFFTRIHRIPLENFWVIRHLEFLHLKILPNSKQAGISRIAMVIWDLLGGWNFVILVKKQGIYKCDGTSIIPLPNSKANQILVRNYRKEIYPQLCKFIIKTISWTWTVSMACFFIRI